ncbi:uncharacterized protein LOC112343694 isoform X2 [Selaginella moellendorffii]|nr:uncharacterized protein LOC112343694 isoform X2 [Selaginella moellendorffii]|eukprot:XP_024523425.1 uncharacterized protein LOC112343694 isoform X2 [Selaginella moellendorffii]
MRTPQPRPKAAKSSSSAAEDDDKGKKRLASTAFLEDESVLDPKVMVPYVTKVGEIPRKVQVERKKRLYALQDAGVLLAAEGLENLDLGSETGRLPLHWFDNTDFETRLPSNWIDKVSVVSAQAAYVNYEGRCVWKHCLAIDFIEENDTYLVQWEDTGQTLWLPRQ